MNLNVPVTVFLINDDDTDEKELKVTAVDVDTNGIWVYCVEDR